MRCVVTQGQRQEQLSEHERVASVVLLEQVQGVRVVEGRIEADLIRQVVQSTLLFLIRREYLRAIRTIILVCIKLGDPLILFILVEVGDIVDLKGSWEARIVPEKRALWTDYGVDLSHRLHNLQIVVVELRGDQIYVPHGKVSVEKDDCFHGQLG